jgi:cell division protein FtsW (lipid II flippase)
MKDKKVDKFFLGIFGIIVILGIFVFVSASLGILAKNKQIFYSVLMSQLVLGLGLGTIGMYVSYKINYKFWRKYAFFIFLGELPLYVSY